MRGHAEYVTGQRHRWGRRPTAWISPERLPDLTIAGSVLEKLSRPRRELAGHPRPPATVHSKSGRGFEMNKAVGL